jgi:hypothetical protein
MLPVNKIRAVIAFMLAVVVMFILITPDRTDDVDGVLHLGKRAHVHALGLASAMNVALTIHARERSYVVTGTSVQPGLLELLCAHRC